MTADNPLIPADERLKDQRDFTQAPNEILCHPRLSMQAKILWLLIYAFCFHGFKAWPGMERIAEFLNVSEKTAKKYRDELEDEGLIDVNRRGQGRTNKYSLYAPETNRGTNLGSELTGGSHQGKESEPSKGSNLETNTDPAQNPKPCSDKENEVQEDEAQENKNTADGSASSPSGPGDSSMSDSTSTGTNVDKPTDSESRSTSTDEPELDSADEHFPVSSDLPKNGRLYEYPEPFNDVWEEYPDRDGPNPKKAAYKKFRARITQDDYTVDELMDAVQTYRLYCQDKGKLGTEYVKQAQTFFGPDDHVLDFFKMDKEQYEVTDPSSMDYEDNREEAREAFENQPDDLDKFLEGIA